MLEHYLYHIGVQSKKHPNGEIKCDVSKNMNALKGTVDPAALALHCCKY